MEGRGELPTIRVILLGKTGSGKSSLGNTLLGCSTKFNVVSGMLSGTAKCDWSDGVFEDLEILLQVTDTPGVCDTHTPEDKVIKEIGKSVAVSSPGPHVILMVMRCDKRFTKEEYMAYQTLKKMFGPDIGRHMVLVFCGLDILGKTRDLQKAKFEEDLKQCTQQLSGVMPVDLKECAQQLTEMLTDASGRYFCIDNTAKGDELKSQARELMQMMKKLVITNGGFHKYFTNELSEKVQRMVEPLVRDTMSQQNKNEVQAIRETNTAIIDESVTPKFWENLMDVITKALMPAVQLVVSTVAMVGANLVVKSVEEKSVEAKSVAAKCSVM